MPDGFAILVQYFHDAQRDIVAERGAARLHMCLRSISADQGDRLSVLRDQFAIIRLIAAMRCERAARGQRIGMDCTCAPTAYRRTKLTQLLAIYDALDSDVEPRELAYRLVFPHHQPLTGAAWKGSSERRHTLRLIAEARRLVTSGHRKLLHHD